MNLKNVVIAGVAAEVVNFVFIMLTCGWLFNWVYFIKPTNVWKPWAVEGLILMIAGGLVLNILLAYVYALFYRGIPGKGVKKGLWYGFGVWLVGTLPGMFSVYTLMAVAPFVVLYWTVRGFVGNLLLGAVIAAVYKEK
jgi:hypothetical protein